MKMPREVIIGNTIHHICSKKMVVVRKTVCHGSFDEESRTISIAQGNPIRGYKYDADERANTFWHELTYAILYDMGNALTHNEKFVSDFSNRLHQAIKTAKF